MQKLWYTSSNTLQVYRPWLCWYAVLSGSIFATQARVWSKYKKVAMGHYGQHLGMVSDSGISNSIASSSKAGAQCPRDHK